SATGASALAPVIAPLDNPEAAPYVLIHATRRCRVPRAGRPQPTRNLRTAHAGRGRGEGPHGALPHLAARRVATPCHAPSSGARVRATRGASRLLPCRAQRASAAARLD